MWSRLWSILVCKIPQFWAKVTDSAARNVFLESRHSEVTKNLYYALYTRRSQIPIFYAPARGLE